MKTKKIFSMLLLTIFTIMCLPLSTFVEAAGTGVPTIGIYGPSSFTVNQGGSVTFEVVVSNATKFNLKTSDIGIAGNGVTLTKNVSGQGNRRIVTLSNIKGPENKLVSIAIRAGVASNENGSTAQTPKTAAFRIVGSQGGNTSVDNSNNNSSANTSSNINSNGGNKKNTNQNTNTAGGAQTGNEVGAVEKNGPTITVSQPNELKVNKGQTITYQLSYEDDINVAGIDLKPDNIITHGFNCEVKVISGTNNTRLVVLRNIDGDIGEDKYIEIAESTAWDDAGNKSGKIEASPKFSIVEEKIVPSDSTRPSIGVSKPDPDTVYTGDTVKYVVTYADNINVAEISLKKEDITLYGFTADVEVTGEGDTRTITLTNIQGSIGGMKYIKIAGGTAYDTSGNESFGIPMTSAFRIIDRSSQDVDLSAIKLAEKNSKTVKPIEWVQNPNTSK